MNTIQKLPLEDTNDEYGLISELCFNNGDQVSKGKIVYTFETSKSVTDVQSEADGYIFYIPKVGEEIKIGSIVCVITQEKDFDINSFKQQTSCCCSVYW